jgi:hypothetical protein
MNHGISLDLGAKMATSLCPQRAAKLSRDCRPYRDGRPDGKGPALARQVMEIVAPQIRAGGLVMNDNGGADYLAYLRDPANGFRSMSPPPKGRARAIGCGAAHR